MYGQKKEKKNSNKEIVISILEPIQTGLDRGIYKNSRAENIFWTWCD